MYNNKIFEAYDLTFENVRDLAKNLILKNKETFTSDDLLSICQALYLDENNVFDFVKDISGKNILEEEMDDFLEDLLNEIALMMSKNQLLALSVEDIELLSEKLGCSFHDMKYFYINNRYKETNICKWKKRIGLNDRAKAFRKKPTYNQNKVQDAHELNLRIGKNKYLWNDTLLTLQEKLNEEKIFFLELLNQEKDRDEEMNLYKHYLQSTINDIKKIRKHINHIINQKITINLEKF